MYQLISDLSYDYSDWSGYSGEAGKIEFEVTAIPGIASSIAAICNQWVSSNGYTMETFGI